MNRTLYMKNWLKILYADLTALLLGIALAFAFAPYEIFPLAVIAPAGLLALLLKATPKRAFWLGFLFGLGLFGAGVYWVFISIHLFGDVPNFLAGIITGVLIGYLALFPAMVSYLTNRYFPFAKSAKMMMAFPALWVFSEWVRSWLFTGFPWLFLGYSQTNSPLKGFAPILSVYGVSLAVIMTSALIVNAMIKFKEKEYQTAYLSLLAFVTIWLAGGLISLIPWTKQEGKPISVSLVQGNIPQELKWAPEHLKLSFDRYAELTEPLWKKGNIIIWPEAAIPMSLQSASAFIQTMDEKARASGSHLILGIPIQSSDGFGYYNSVVTLGADKKAYLKRRLVPFGEYVPFTQILSHVFNYMNIPISNLIPGKNIQEPLIIGDIKILTSICYEIAFPELVKSRDKTIGLLLTVTNDAWFGESSAQAQHLQIAEMRALELGRPVLFIGNDGITAMISSDGKIESAAPPHQSFVLNGTVQPAFGLTPWMRYGMNPILFIMTCLLFAAIRSNIILRKMYNPEAAVNP